MSRIVVYHNSGCSKSRGALEILRERGVDFDVIEYLRTPLARADLERLLDLLPDPPAELVRQDPQFEELGLDPADYTTREAVIDLLLRHPRLMQRPVVVRGQRALIARPPEKLEALLD